MMPQLKRLRLAFFFFITLGLPVTVLAQGMWVPTTTRIQTPYGPATITSHQYMPMYYNYSYGMASGKHTFKVTLKNDSLIEVKGRIDVNDSIHSITFKKHKEKHTLLPSETKEVYRITQEGKKIVGIATDSCWLFKIKKGAINCYAYVAEEMIEYTVAIQEGNDGEILPLTEDNLIYMVGDDPKAVKMVHKKKFTQAISSYNWQKSAESKSGK